MWAAKRGRGRKELGKGTDKVMTEEKSILFRIQSIPEVQIAMSPQQRGRPVNVQLNGCDIPRTDPWTSQALLHLSQDAVSFRRGFLEGGENNLKKLSTFSVMKLLNQREDRPRGVTQHQR